MYPRGSPRGYRDDEDDDDELQRAIEFSLQQTNSGRQERIERIFRLYDKEPSDGVIEYGEFRSLVHDLLWLQYGEAKAKRCLDSMTIFLATIALPADEQRDYLIPDDFMRLADCWQTNITKQNQFRDGCAIACPWEFHCDNFISIAEPGLIEKLQEIKKPKPKSEEGLAQPCDLTALIRLYHDDYPSSPLPLHKFNSLIYDLACIQLDTLELDDFMVVDTLTTAFSSQSLDDFTLEQLLLEWKMHLRLNNLHESYLYSIWENASAEMIQKLKNTRLHNLVPSTNWVYTSLERRGLWVSPDIIKQMNGWRLIKIDENAALVMQIPSSQQDLNELFNYYTHAVPIMTISAFRRFIHSTSSDHHIPNQKEIVEKQTQKIGVVEASDIIDTELNKLGYSLTRTMNWREVMAPDGNCFYRAIAYTWYGNANLYQNLRSNIARMYSQNSVLESVFGSKQNFWNIIIRPIEPRLNNLEYSSISSQVIQEEIDNYIASIQSDGQWLGAGQVDDGMISVTAIYLNARIVVFDMSNIERNIIEGRGNNVLRTFYTFSPPSAHTENTIFILRLNGVHYDAINITSLRNTT